MAQSAHCLRPGLSSRDVEVQACRFVKVGYFCPGGASAGKVRPLHQPCLLHLRCNWTYSCAFNPCTEPSAVSFGVPELVPDKVGAMGVAVRAASSARVVCPHPILLHKVMCLSAASWSRCWRCTQLQRRCVFRLSRPG